MSLTDEPSRRAKEYAKEHEVTLGEQLGFGIHGIVFIGEKQAEKQALPVRSAIKAHRREQEYRRERDVYLRLRVYEVRTIRGCAVPELIRYDDELWILEMTVVSRPFVLDFGGAYLDVAPDFSDEVLTEWRAEKAEEFGRHWAEVLAILRELQSYGIFMIDVNLGNISFGA